MQRQFLRTSIITTLRIKTSVNETDRLENKKADGGEGKLGIHNNQKWKL